MSLIIFGIILVLIVLFLIGPAMFPGGFETDKVKTAGFFGSWPSIVVLIIALIFVICGVSSIFQ